MYSEFIFNANDSSNFYSYAFIAKCNLSVAFTGYFPQACLLGAVGRHTYAKFSTFTVESCNEIQAFEIFCLSFSVLLNRGISNSGILVRGESRGNGLEDAHAGVAWWLSPLPG